MKRRISTRIVLLAGVLLALVLAGGVSFYASSDPDGLDRVAQDAGFASAEKEHPTEDSPLAGYDTEGIGDPRLSGGLAGVSGAVIVLVVAGGLAFALRRRGR